MLACINSWYSELPLLWEEGRRRRREQRRMLTHLSSQPYLIDGIPALYL